MTSASGREAVLVFMFFSPNVAGSRSDHDPPGSSDGAGPNATVPPVNILGPLGGEPSEPMTRDSIRHGAQAAEGLAERHNVD